jgi:hypothetical protein
MTAATNNPNANQPQPDPPAAADVIQPKANAAQAAQTVEARTHAKAYEFVKRLVKEGAKFTRDDSGEVSLHYGGKIISLEPGSRDVPNYDLDELLSLDGCPGTETLDCRVERKWLQLMGRQLTKGTAATHRFSAAGKEERLYVPVADGILSVTQNGVKKAVNVENPDGIILEPAKGQEPFTFVDEPPAEGLRLFEELAVKMQTVVVPEMAWLTAMQEMLFSFLAPSYHRERMIVVHTGSKDGGKTGSEQHYLSLHGFKEPTTKITPAGFHLLRSSGIVFLDNQEEHNLTDALQDTLITMASGGGKQTAYQHISGPRPIISITTIESFEKSELKNRSVAIEHSLDPEAIVGFSALEHEKKLLAARDRIMSALMHVLAEFKRQPVQKEVVPTGAGKFSDNYRALCGLLLAYERTAQKDAGWADAIIAVWNQQLTDNTPAANETLSHVVKKFIDKNRHTALVIKDPYSQGAAKQERLANADLEIVEVSGGTLYVTTPAGLHHWALLNGYKEQVPKKLIVLRWEDVSSQRHLTPYKELIENHAAVAVLQRGSKNDARPVGFFVPARQQK